MPSAHTKINTVREKVIYNELCIRILFCAPVKKTIKTLFTKINSIGKTMTYNIHTKFEINRMYHFDT